MPAEESSFPPDIPTGVPTPARIYDYMMGGKDNFAIDRQTTLAGLPHYPEGLDAARANRLFLYRAVRFLARDAGITQFLDLGSGLPTQSNVHEVAQAFQPRARVAYVDNDPIVLAHGRALLAEDASTTVVEADLGEPEQVLAHPDLRRLLDFTRPVAALFLSVTHSIADDTRALRAVRGVTDHLAAGSYVALTQFAAAEERTAEEFTARMLSVGVIEWKTRTPAQIDAFLAGLDPVDPGLLDIRRWRPDAHQPPLSNVDAPLQPYLGASAAHTRVHEYGGVLRKP